jgi:hypothetical protein
MFRINVVEKIKTRFMFNNFFFQNLCRLWDNVEKYCRAEQATDGNIARRVRIACWITKATDTHSQYVVFIAFLPQQLLHERDLVLRYTSIACNATN